MSKTLNRNAVEMASALTKDITGNLLTGNEHRAMIYLKALNKTLDALVVKLDAGNDVRAERKLEAELRDIYAQMEKEHEAVPYHADDLQESAEKWSALGFTVADFAQPVGEDLTAQILAQNGLEMVGGKLVKTGVVMGEA